MSLVSVPKTRTGLDDGFRAGSVVRNAERCGYACASEYYRVLRVLDQTGQFGHLLLNLPIRVNDLFGSEVREILFSCESQ